MATITTTIPFSIRTGAGLKSFSVGTNPADELDAEHPFVLLLRDKKLLTIELDEAEAAEAETGETKAAAPATGAKAKTKIKA